MISVWIPALLQELTGGVEQVELKAGSVREAIRELDRRFPGIAERLCQDDEIRPGMSVVINDQVSGKGIRARLPEDSELHFLPAISGGSSAALR